MKVGTINNKYLTNLVGHVLADAMAYLKRKPVILDYFETLIFQSDKCFAVFPPI